MLLWLRQDVDAASLIEFTPKDCPIYGCTRSRLTGIRSSIQDHDWRIAGKDGRRGSRNQEKPRGDRVHPARLSEITANAGVRGDC